MEHDVADVETAAHDEQAEPAGQAFEAAVTLPGVKQKPAGHAPVHALVAAPPVE